MILQEIIIEEAGLQKHKSREQILNLINSQINQHKLQYWSEWEGNHNLSPILRDEKINALNDKKVQVEKFFKEVKSDKKNIDIAFSIHIKTEQSKLQKVLA
jgi:hypothetical protein